MAKAATSWKKLVFFGILLAVAYFIFRLTNLTKIPIFTDEAIYIRWSQIGSRDANWRFISLVDGKQPLFTWIMMVFLKILKGDPLFVGRLVSVVSGFATLVGIWILTKELFGRIRIAFLAILLYIISPFFLMYDRLALYDSLVTTLSVWNLYFAVLLVKKPRLDTAMILGFTLGAGMLNKSSGFLSLYLLPFTAILFTWKGKNLKNRFLTWVGYALLAAVLSQVYYSVLRLSPLFNMVSAKNAVFVYPFSEWIHHPFQFLYGNLKGLYDWMVNYLTYPIVLAALAGAVSINRNIREKLVLVVFWLLPFVALAMFGRVLYPRFILFMTAPLIILSAVCVNWIIEKWGKKVFGIAFLAFIILPSVTLSYFIVTNPQSANIPISDRQQLMDDWPSGGGISESVSYLTNQAKTTNIAIYTDGTFGLLPYAIEIYLVDNPKVEIHGIWPLPKEIPKEIADKALVKPVYFIANQIPEAPNWPMKLIFSVQKGRRPDKSLRLYQVLSPVIATKPADIQL